MAAPQPAFIGLTGAIGSGKTEALRALARLGAATLSTDEAAHEALGDAGVVAKLVERWGEEVARDGTVDRKRVAEIVFADRDELRWLESITHPKVAERVVEWQAGLGEGIKVAVVEVPLLFEANMQAFFDGVLVIVAGERRAAWLEARGDGAVEGRTGRQFTEAEKAERATWVVENDGSLEDLEAKLSALWPRLLAAKDRE